MSRVAPVVAMLAAGAVGVSAGLWTPSSSAVRDDWKGKAPEDVFAAELSRIRELNLIKADPQELRDGGLSGVAAALGDPHTVYLPAKEAKAFTEQTQANFFGVGARLSPDPLGAKAVRVFTSGPAYRAGLRDNDIITRVNGKSMVGKPVDAIVDLIKGPQGTLVKLGIVRKGVSRPIELSIRRARIVTPTVEGKYLADSKIGYLAMSQVSEPTALQFDAELAKLEAQKIRGLVIDVRGNPGGLLGVVAEVVSRYVDNRTVVTMKAKGEQEVVKTLSGLAKRPSYPIVVLQDENSASAAEIFAGCMRDYGIATLVGTHTYGKASVQSLYPLRDGSLAKVTIAKYYLPNGEFIGRKVDPDGVYLSGGLEPNVKEELNLDMDPVVGDPKSDSQLRKAIQIIRSKSRG